MTLQRELKCPGCERRFVTTSAIKKFCNRRCRRDHAVRTHRPLGAYPGLATATVGAISELRVASDLLTKGYEVFRAVSAACSCDLAVLKNGRLIRVEVRTAYCGWNGAFGTGPRSPRDEGRQDVFAWALPDRIVYEPEL